MGIENMGQAKAVTQPTPGIPTAPTKPKLRKAVVILGAGASADFGVPVLNRIFKDTQASNWLRDEGKWLHDYLQRVYWNPRGLSLPTSNDGPNIEEILTLTREWDREYAHRFDFKDPDFARLRKEFYLCIQRAVFQGKSSSGEFLNQLLRTFDATFDEVTWASFNWDCIFEASFWYTFRRDAKLVIPVDGYGNESKHKFLKLHGGVNWWADGAKVHYLPFARGGSMQPTWDAFAADKSAAKQGPVILEPSYYKYEDAIYRLLEPQWAHYIDDLLDAEVALVIGYSLPDGDSQGRAQLQLAFQHNDRLQIGVVDPAPEIINRYKRLFGSLRRRSFDGGLAGFNNDLINNLSALFPDITWKSPSA